jgi:hypothetical protein
MRSPIDARRARVLFCKKKADRWPAKFFSKQPFAVMRIEILSKNFLANFGTQ